MESNKNLKSRLYNALGYILGTLAMTFGLIFVGIILCIPIINVIFYYYCLDL